MRVFDFNSAIVRTPGRSVVNGLRAASGPRPSSKPFSPNTSPMSPPCGSRVSQVTVLAALEQFPDSIFVEDPALVFSQAALLLRPGAPSRMAEAQELARRSRPDSPSPALGDGFADGGDILVTPGRVLIGLSARTNEAGAAAFAEAARIPSASPARWCMFRAAPCTSRRTARWSTRRRCSRPRSWRNPESWTVSGFSSFQKEERARDQRAAGKRRRVRQVGLPAHSGDAGDAWIESVAAARLRDRQDRCRTFLHVAALVRPSPLTRWHAGRTRPPQRIGRCRSAARSRSARTRSREPLRSSLRIRRVRTPAAGSAR